MAKTNILTTEVNTPPVETAKLSTTSPNTYIWTVDSMVNYPTYADQTEVVVVVNWICTGTNGTQTGRLAGATGIPYDSTDPFIPYANLTSDIVIGWVQAALGAEGVTSILSDIDGQIIYAAMPQQASPLPWE
jgi:hypothetical protein